MTPQRIVGFACMKVNDRAHGLSRRLEFELTPLPNGKMQIDVVSQPLEFIVPENGAVQLFVMDDTGVKVWASEAVRLTKGECIALEIK